VLRWFKTQSSIEQPLRVDIHSHLLPALDDGVPTFEEAEKIILQFIKLGYKKLITTPHVMSDRYCNTPDIINRKLLELRQHLLLKNITIEIQAAAEYYLDESLMQMLDNNQPLLTLGNNYLLFETNFVTESFLIKDFIFKALTKGYKPILAHPERYLYLQNNFSKIQELLDRGVLFQLNISSLTAYYSKPAQQMAFKLIDRRWVHWLGSDCHLFQHIKLMENAFTSHYCRKALTLPLLNNSLQ
jgi:protein-tyrosine phosphatase